MRGEIETAGEEGRADRVDRARADLEAADDALQQAERDAAAADLLSRVLIRHRDDARRSYVAPFRQAVERLSRLVANLLDNAVKWNPQGQPIEVTLHDRLLTVRDHGPGFADDDLPHVFDRFYRSTAARGMPGSGLGLSIVQQVAEMHGATATAGNAPGGGAIMTIAFPPLDDA